MDAHVHFTEHAELRCAQRNYSKGDVMYVLEHGRWVYRAGTKMYYLCRRDVPREDLRDSRIARLIGLCVQTTQEEGTILVLTLYPNKNSGLKDHRRKSKYNRSRTSAA